MATALSPMALPAFAQQLIDMYGVKAPMMPTMDTMPTIKAAMNEPVNSAAALTATPNATAAAVAPTMNGSSAGSFLGGLAGMLGNVGSTNFNNGNPTFSPNVAIGISPDIADKAYKNQLAKFNSEASVRESNARLAIAKEQLKNEQTQAELARNRFNLVELPQSKASIEQSQQATAASKQQMEHAQKDYPLERAGKEMSLVKGASDIGMAAQQFEAAQNQNEIVRRTMPATIEAMNLLPIEKKKALAVSDSMIAMHNASANASFAESALRSHQLDQSINPTDPLEKLRMTSLQSEIDKNRQMAATSLTDMFNVSWRTQLEETKMKDDKEYKDNLLALDIGKMLATTGKSILSEEDAILLANKKRDAFILNWEKTHPAEYKAADVANMYAATVKDFPLGGIPASKARASQLEAVLSKIEFAEKKADSKKDSEAAQASKEAMTIQGMSGAGADSNTQKKVQEVADSILKGTVPKSIMGNGGGGSSVWNKMSEAFSGNSTSTPSSSTNTAKLSPPPPGMQWIQNERTGETKLVPIGQNK